MAVAERGGSQGWAGFTRLLVVTAAILFLALFGCLLAVDPYDTGRTGVIATRGVHDQYPFTGNVSRARDQSFDAAIVGNSHLQLLQPKRMSEATGLRFVQLTIPATRPRDTLDSLAWWLSNRTSPPKAVVIGIDHYWCLPQARNTERFPAWLYSRSLATYLAGLVRYRSFEVALARLRYLRGGSAGLRPDGYWDYAPLYEAGGLADPEATRRRLEPIVEFPINPDGPFPAVDALRSALAALPDRLPAILVWPPLYRTALPRPGSPGAATEAACRAALVEVAASRMHTVFVDRLHAHADEPDSFYDHDHVRHAAAAEIEADVARALDRARR